MLEWCRAWKIDPEHPSRSLPSSVRQKEDPVIKFGPRYDDSNSKAGGLPWEQEDFCDPRVLRDFAFLAGLPSTGEESDGPPPLWEPSEDDEPPTRQKVGARGRDRTPGIETYVEYVGALT